MFHSDEPKTSRLTIQIKTPTMLTIPPKDRLDHPSTAVTKLHHKADPSRHLCRGCEKEIQKQDKTRCNNCGSPLCVHCCCEDEGEILCSNCFDDVQVHVIDGSM